MRAETDISPTGPTPGVPFWALELVKDVATIKGRTEALPKIEIELDAIRKEAVPMREHEGLMKRTDELWTAYQRLRGGVALLGLLNLGLTIYVGLHTARVLP